MRNGLHEISAAELELRNDSKSILRYRDTIFAWGRGNLDATMPGGADGHEFFGRFDAVIDHIAGSGVEIAAAFTHGAAIRVWGSPGERWALAEWADQSVPFVRDAR